jgi:hypothetical protein
VRDYAKFLPAFWYGDTGKQIRSLGPDGYEVRIVASYLLTAPTANMLGLYYLPLPMLAHESGVPLEGASKALRWLSEEGFAHYDAASEMVWVVNMAAIQIGDDLDIKDKQVSGIRKQYAQLPNNPFLGAFFDKYAKAYHMEERREPVQKRSPLQAPLKALRSQETEQEQDQETEKEQETEQEKEKPVPLADARSSGRPDRSADIAAVNEHYLTHHPRAAKTLGSGTDEYKKIRARLDQDGFTVEDLKQAIDGCHKSPHHCGENPSGAKYQSLELIVRDRKHVLQFIEVYEQHSGGPVPVLSERERRGLRANDAFMALTDRKQTIEAEVTP